MIRDVVVVAMAFALTATAAAGGSLEAGVKVGVSRVWFSGADYNEPLDDVEAQFRAVNNEISQTHVVGGVHGTYFFQQGLGVRIEALYARFGAGYQTKEIAGLIPGLMVNHLWSFDAIEVPLCLVGRLPVREGWLRAGFGPDVFWIPGNITYQTTIEPYVAGFHMVGTSEFVDDDDRNRVAFGVAASIGLGVPIGPGCVDLEIRYSLMMTGFLEGEDRDAFYGNSAGVLLGYSSQTAW